VLQQSRNELGPEGGSNLLRQLVLGYPATQVPDDDYVMHNADTISSASEHLQRSSSCQSVTMAMAVDTRNHQSHLKLPGYEGLRYQQVPHFTNPWANSAIGTPQSHIYTSSALPSSSGVDASHQASRPTTLPIPAYGIPVTASGLGAGSTPQVPFYSSQNGIDISQDLLNAPRLHSAQYSTAGASTSFSDAVDASRGMVSLSHSDITPRNIYDVRANSSKSSTNYSFPSTHSNHSSISSASPYLSSYGYNPSIAGSDISDYSSVAESVDVSSRTLPRPTNFPGAAPPPQSMMGQFSSKLSRAQEKKHKCKVCDKRFTRPSSLQTHMYSHTGEKPFACEVEGCGRHFSVVSNLRRHRKVHKGESMDHPSPDD
jgi:hypothetical protein